VEIGDSILMGVPIHTGWHSSDSH